MTGIIADSRFGIKHGYQLSVFSLLRSESSRFSISRQKASGLGDHSYRRTERTERASGSFNFKVSHFMRLTASLGFAAKYWSASVIFVCPVHRKTEIAVFRRAAMT